MQESKPSPSRRRFFAGTAAVGAAAAAAVALPHVLETPEANAEAARPAPEKGGGYHLSAHVKHYYQTTKI